MAELQKAAVDGSAMVKKVIDDSRAKYGDPDKDHE
jgi:hypothetical protein